MEREIKPGPRETGFDYSFIIATGDRVPCVYVENGKVVRLNPSDPISVDYGPGIRRGEPTGISARSTLKMDWDHGHKDGCGKRYRTIGFMKGGRSALWVDETYG